MVFVDEHEVYAPAEDTFLLATVIGKEPIAGKNVLEIGCGSGYLTKLTVERGAQVTAVDVNPAAVETTKSLLEENHLRADVFRSDLFSEVTGKFDLIIFNSPYLPSGEAEETANSPIYHGGASGREVIEKFVKQSTRHLKAGGKILLMISSLTDERKVAELFEENGLICRSVARQKIDWEELIVLEARSQSLNIIEK